MTSDHSHPSTSHGDSATVTSLPHAHRKSHYGPRGRQFLYKHGSKVHAYEPAKAPWPLSYDQSSLELEMMDTALVSGYQGAVSLVDHKGKEPARCLDLGTGLGLWVMQSVKYWKRSTFVGFDLVDIQIPLSLLEPEDAERVEWVHGNILTGRLPFSDEEFDHVRFTQVSLGIPESKWPTVFEEIRRVMKPGATIEMIEEDAIFPVLPRWFTEPLHARTRWPSISMQDGSKLFSNPSLMANAEVAHEYELLEILYTNVFDRRFINMQPTSALPAYFTNYFGHVVSPPVLTVPMPPLPPVQPRPRPRPTRNSLSSRASNSSQSILFGDPAYFLADGGAKDEISIAMLHNPAAPGAHPPPVHTSTTVTASGVVVRESHSDSRSTHSGHSHPGQGTGSAHGRPSLTVGAAGSPSRSGSGSGPRPSRGDVPRSTRSARSNSASSQASLASKRAAALSDLAAESTTIGERAEIEVFPIDSLLMFDLHSLCLHLRRALGVVLGVREAMWDELQAMWKAPRPSVDLGKYGFSLSEDTLETVRSKFDALLDQYKSDMHVRMSIWHSLVHFGWEYPQRDPMSKAEEMEELRLREDILVARRRAGAENEREPPCRAVRVLVGAKVALPTQT
ncbi:hypothetical protein BD413DRAFT_463145 [Trametes elegans]|nr:hypothetical protein BD413DRAFT_463145 [Trametes elegans]